MKTLLLIAVALISLQSEVLAQERQPDILYLTGEGASGASLSGGRAEAEWLHWVSPLTNVTLGGTSTSLGDLLWTYGTVGAFTRRSHVMLSGRTSLGSGRYSAGGSLYARYAGSATVPIARGFYAESEGQYVRLAGTDTTVFKIGGLYAGPRGVTLQVAYYAARSGIVHPRSVSARGGFNMGRFGLSGGATESTQEVPETDLSTIVLSTYHSREAFIGMSVMTGHSQVIGVLEVVPQPDGRLNRVTVTWRLPLGQATSIPQSASR